MGGFINQQRELLFRVDRNRLRKTGGGGQENVVNKIRMRQMLPQGERGIVMGK